MYESVASWHRLPQSQASVTLAVQETHFSQSLPFHTEEASPLNFCPNMLFSLEKITGHTDVKVRVPYAVFVDRTRYDRVQLVRG